MTPPVRGRDGWLLPTEQADHPTRPVLSAARLHGRREAVFLVLAALLFVPITALPVLGAIRTIELAVVLPDLDLPDTLTLPVGVLAFPLALLAVNLAAELYGPRRAGALAAVGTIAGVAAAGLLRAADVLAVTDEDGHDLFGPGLALASAGVAAVWLDVLLFRYLRAAWRRLWLRHVIAVFVAQAGWGAYALVSLGMAHGGTGAETLDAQLELHIALPSAAYTFAAAALGFMLLAPAAGILRVYLRAPHVTAPAADADAGDPAWATAAPRAQPPAPEARDDATQEVSASDLIELGSLGSSADRGLRRR